MRQRDDDLVAVLVTEDRAIADEAWGRLATAGIPATVVTQPAMMGAYELFVQVERSDFDRAEALLVDLRV